MTNTVVDDSLSPDLNDKVDFFMVVLKGAPGTATVELRWDDPAADLAIDVMDAWGAVLGTTPARTEGSVQKTLDVPIATAGSYYLKVTALADKPASYTFTVKWPGGAAK